MQESGGDFRNGQEEKEKEGGAKSEEKEVKDKLAQRIMNIMEKDNIDEKEKEKSHLKIGESTTSVDTEKKRRGKEKIRTICKRRKRKKI